MLWNVRRRSKTSSSSKFQLEPGETTKGGAKIRKPQTKAHSYCHLGDGGPAPTRTHICMSVASKQVPNEEEEWREMPFQGRCRGESRNICLRTAVFRINGRVSSSSPLQQLLASDPILYVLPPLSAGIGQKRRGPFQPAEFYEKPFSVDGTFGGFFWTFLRTERQKNRSNTGQ